MPKKTNPLPKNPFLKTLKNDPSIKVHKVFTKNKKPNASFLAAKERQKIFVNDAIIEARIKHKLRTLPIQEQKNAQRIFSEIFMHIMSRSSNNPEYVKKANIFIKDFAAALNRKEGQVVMDLLKRAKEGVYKL